MQRPTFFIAGAPKCGTTALYTWLSTHPKVCMSQPKEPQFFAGDILGHQRNITTLEDYLRCFEKGGPAKEVGEASTCYLASPSAARQIKTFNPEAKIIVMLRNPVEMMYSLHSERVFSNMENICDFASAVDSAGERTWAEGRFRGQRVIRPSYREMVRFTEQLRRFINVFGRDRVHVIFYDDLLASAAIVYKTTLDFLGLEPDQRESFEVVNENKRARSLSLLGVVRHPGKTVRHVGRFLLPRPTRAVISEWVNRLTTVQEPRPALSTELRRRLVGEFEGEIEALGTLLGRDLSLWRKG